ncbi:MAG: DoxX family membrane protein [Bryobacteraceae bacterium]
MNKIVISIVFLVAGTLHFLIPAPFVRIVPPMLPWPGALVAISGAAEILGGAGLLLNRTRRVAAYGLVLLLIAVFPANIYMAMERIPLPGMGSQSPLLPWLLWLRLPLQFLLIAWVWRYTK